MGLLGKHCDELNKKNVPDGRYDELRKEYKDNPKALQQIDVFDPDTEYHPKLRELNDAYRRRDTGKEEELDAWFKEHYPDV